MVHLRTSWYHAIVTAFCVGLLTVNPVWAQLGSTQIIVQQGDAAPDGNGTIGSLGAITRLNDAGQVGYIVDQYNGTAGGALDDSSINLFTGGVSQVIVREGDAAPDANGLQNNFDGSDFKGLGSGGAVLFTNSLTGTAGGTADDIGVFQGTASSVSQIARELSPAPVATGDWDSFGGTMSVGGSNIHGFVGGMINTPGGTADDSFVARAIGGSATIVAREGDTIPVGTGTFGSFGSPYVNAAGQMSFYAGLTGTAGGTADNVGLFRVNADGSETQLVRKGSTAPDGNGTFSGFQTVVPINSSGRTVFQSSLTGTGGGTADNSGTFSSSGGSITQIARRGDTAPDGNGTLSSIASNGLRINDSNRVAFINSLTGTANGTLDDSGLFVGSGGALTQIIREG